METSNFSQNEIADKLDVAHSTFSQLMRGDSRISPEMAIRLSKVIGRSPESWITMQAYYDLHLAKKANKGLSKLKKLNFLEVNSSNPQATHA